MSILKKTLAVTLCAASALSMAACGSDPLADDSSSSDSSSDSIIIGSADFSESQLVATIYSHVLQKKSVTVKEKLNIGSREVYMDALKDGSIDLIPEYSGTLLNYLDSKNSETDSAKIVDALKTSLPKGIIPLDASEAEDVDVIAVSKEFSEKNNVKSISDLKDISSDVTLGGPSEWKARYIGLKGLESVYGLKFKDFQVLDAGGPLTLSALTGGQIQAGDMFSSDPAVKDNGLVALKDDKQLFAAAQVLPIIRESKASDTVKKSLNEISKKLTTNDLIAMNRKVNDGSDIGDVADEWISSKNIA